jgi:four helix bundle protein
MSESDPYIFDHEKLHVYQAALSFLDFVSVQCSELEGRHRHARDQIQRASLSIPLNIAEGNGTWSSPDRKRFFEIARGSATECAACLDALRVTSGLTPEKAREGKLLLRRIVAMLTKLTDRSIDQVRESEAAYSNGSIDYDYEHEHEHERKSER